MKTTIILLLFIIIASHAFAQMGAQTREYYLAKSNNQKKAAWILFGSGMAITKLGITITKSNSADYRHGNASNGDGLGSVVTIIGATAVFASIPVFIKAAHNKHEAISLAADLQNLQTLHTAGVITVAQPSIKIRVNL